MEAQERGASYVGARGIAALRNTRPWALLVGIVAIVAAALAVVNAVVYSFLPHYLPANAPGYAAVLSGEGIVVVGAVVNVVIYGFTAWFALQYGRGLALSMRNKDAAKLEAALWWQRRYWTLQGVLMIVLIALFVLVIIAVIILGVVLAMHRQSP